MKRFSPAFERGLAAMALVGTFVVTASIVQPHLSSASQPRGVPRSTVQDVGAEDTILHNEPPVVREAPTTQLLTLGDLIGRSYVVRIYMSGDLPRFSVFNHDGSIVAEMVGEHELKQIVDDPDLHSNIAGFIDENTILMSAEPTTDRPGE